MCWIYVYMDVGDQKFISLNSDGRAFINFGAPTFVFDFGTANASSASSLMCDATDVVDVASRWTPSKLDKNQPRPLFSTEELCPLLLLMVLFVAAALLLLATTENVPVKYGFCALRIGLGELSGDAGSDFEPRRAK